MGENRNLSSDSLIRAPRREPAASSSCITFKYVAATFTTKDVRKCRRSPESAFRMPLLLIALQLTLPGDARLAVWLIVNVENWEI